MHFCLQATVGIRVRLLEVSMGPTTLLKLSVRSHKTKQADPRASSLLMNQGEITICGRAKAPHGPQQSLKQVIPQIHLSFLTGCFCRSGPNCRLGREGICQLGTGFKGTSFLC